MRRRTAASLSALHDEVSRVVVRRYAERLTLSSIAAELACSPRQLQRAYALAGATSFSEQLRTQRLRAAAELLATQPSLSVAQVAALAGYRSVSYFAGAFRARYGCPPGAYRVRRQACPRGAAPPAGRVSRQAVSRGREPPAAIVVSVSASSPDSASSAGSRRRISVPPPRAGSAVIAPPC